MVLVSYKGSEIQGCYTFPPQTLTIVSYGAGNTGYDDDDEKQASEKKRELQIIK